MGTTLERRLLKEFLEMYRGFECLWNTKDIVYADKPAKEAAYRVLLEKYKEIQEDATLHVVKKKIENMRTAYKRERKKVILRENAGESPYVPTLWYYNLLSFIDECDDGSRTENTSTGNHEELLKKYLLEPKVKRRRSISEVYITEPDDYTEENTDYEDATASDNCTVVVGGHNEVDNRESTREENTLSVDDDNDNTECDAFGTTVGFQLKSVDSRQRAIAQKLISDVIFYARFNRLTVNSTVAVKK